MSLADQLRLENETFSFEWLCCMNRLKALFSHVVADQSETSTL